MIVRDFYFVNTTAATFTTTATARNGVKLFVKLKNVVNS